MRGGAVALLATLAACSAAAVLLRGLRPWQPPPQPPPPPPQPSVPPTPPQQQPQPLTRRLPDCIIIGARKCGTRALLDFLDAHPGVAAAKGEVHYFDSPDKLRLGPHWYRSQMPAARPGQLTVEKTPAYFVTESAPRMARRQMGGDLRLLLIVRDPVTRVISDYAQHLHRRAKSGRPARPLESLVFTPDGDRVNPRARMIDTSVYHRHLRRWLGHFPAGRIHIVDGDRLIAEPHAELGRVERFLGLPGYLRRERFAFNATKGFYCVRRAGAGGEQHRCLGNEKGRRHPTVAPETVARLRHYFAAHDRRLTAITGRRFSWMTRPRQSKGNSSADASTVSDNIATSGMPQPVA